VTPRRALAAVIALALLGGLAAHAAAAPALRSPGLKGLAKKVVTKAPTAPPPAELSANGTRPDLLVDAAGTSHIVWNESTPGAPDTTVYCRVPRNAKGCDGANELSDDAAGPEVVAVNDQVVVLSHRYPQNVPKPGDDGSEADNTLWLWSSDDGGKSFAAPGVVGTGSVGGGAAAYGPVENPSIGGVTGIVTGGTTFTGIQGGRFTLRGALLASGDFVNARIAVRDRVPSVVYMDTGLTTTYLRTWTGQGDPNDPATWSPAQTFPGTDPDVTVAGGRLLVLNEDSTGKLFLRDAAGGAAVPLSTGSAGNGLAIGHPDGRVSVVWNGSEGGARGIWRRDRIVPGAPARGAPGLVSTFEGIFPEASATDDGGGTVVTESGKKILLSAFGSGAATGRPGLGAAAGGQPPLAPDVAVACQKVSFGAVQAELQDGCFLGAQQGRSKVSTGPLRLNGLEIIPDAGVQVIVDPVKRTIRSTGTVSVVLRAPGIPDITLFRGSIQLDASGKGVGESLIKWSEGLFKPNVLGFPVSGDIDVRLTNGGVRIPISLQLPKAFGNIRGAVEVVADNRRGLVLDSLEFSADGVALGPLTLRRLHVQYKATGGTTVGDCLKPPTSGATSLPNEWAGVFELELPPPKTGPAVCGSIRFGDGSFRGASFSVRLPYPGIVLFPGVSLTTLAGGLSLTPAEISAGATFAVIPAGSTGVLTLDARIDLRIDDPFVIRGAARVSAADVTIGDGTFVFSSDGYVSLRLNAGPKIGPLDIKASISGFADGPREQFSLGAKGQVCIDDACAPNSEAVVSTKGIAVCLPLVPRGAGYKWGSPLIGGVKIWPVSCYASDYEVTDARQAAFGDAVPEAGATVPQGAPDVTFRVAGSGGVPDVDLIGPSGAPVAPAASVADPAGFLYLSVEAPPAGSWTVRARPGTPLIDEVSISSSVPAPKVASARVSGRGKARVLRYRATIGEGQAITFVERGRAGSRVLGAAKAGNGRLGFAPGPGPGGRREIVAQLTQNELVVEEVVVTRYTAPPPPRLGRATGLRLRRSGAKVVATWRPGAAAAAQRLSALIAGGQRVNRFLGGRAGRAVLPGVDGRRVSVTVIALARDGHAGRPARASLAAARRR
jgi:hypothetical protein